MSDHAKMTFEPKFFALHFNGHPHAAFLTANAALAFQRGEDSGYFHIVNAQGERVTMAAQPAHPGHAYAILDKLGSGSRTAAPEGATTRRAM